MPKILRRFFRSHSLCWHLGWVLFLGLFARALSAHFVYGPQALDDYKHGVWPAYQFFAGQEISLPEYRSHFLIWILAGFLKIASFVGVSSALTQVRSMYLGLGVLSLLGIVGTYLYVRNFRSKIFGALALYLMALQGLMPFLSTRAFGEALALPFVLLGLGMIEDQRLSKKGGWPVAFGVLSLGVACCLRFHVGLIVLSYGAVLIYLREWKIIGWGILGGVATLAMQVGIDEFSGKAPFETLKIYLAENGGGGAQYGVSPWYNTWAFALGLTLFPFSLLLWRSARGVWRRHWPIIIPSLVFILVHSLVPHKEERFLYPVVGLIWIVLAAFWSASSFSKWPRKVYSPLFLTLNVVLLLCACLVNSQEGEIEPAAYAEHKYGRVLYLDNESLFGQSKFLPYFLRPPSRMEPIGPNDMQMSKIDQSLQAHPDIQAVMMMTSAVDAVDFLRSMVQIKTIESQCGELRQAGSLMDRVLYNLNPKHNQRRRPTWYVVCARTGEGV
jgi:hypothetical protein